MRSIARKKLFAPKTRPRSMWVMAAFAAAVAISLWLAWPAILREPLTFDVDGRTVDVKERTDLQGIAFLNLRELRRQSFVSSR